MLEVTELRGGYGDLVVLHDLSLSVGKGEIVALLGPNGHGKSTLLKAISGVHPATGGSILLDGEQLRGLPAHEIVERGIAYISEERDLFTEMTVFENLVLGAYGPRGRPHLDRNLQRAYELFPRLADRRSQRCATLSGGEARMVAIARGLMSGAEVLLVDEPSIGLSPALKRTVYEAIRHINDDLGITVLLVEQELEYALDLAARVYVLKHGRVLFERSAAEIESTEVREAYF
ncbi:MAG TPA: ABC transporter ATP-binding protein [Egibacteraceae bacterium]|nr:ABC transporter ATP-binding protein [Egibacteraceae bacterium]